MKNKLHSVRLHEQLILSLGLAIQNAKLSLNQPLAIGETGARLFLLSDGHEYD
jgi:hypothetical protein